MAKAIKKHQAGTINHIITDLNQYRSQYSPIKVEVPKAIDDNDPHYHLWISKLKNILFILSVFIFTNTFNTVQASHFSGFKKPLCKSIKGWKDNKNIIEAGYEYCIRSSRLDVKFTNLTQDSIFISNKRGQTFEIEPESFSQYLPYSGKGVFHFVTKIRGRVYMMGNNIIVSPYQTNWITKDMYSRVKNNLPTSPMKNVPIFQVSTISYENPIFTDNLTPNFVEKQTRAFPVVVAVGIGGGIAGAINAWDPNGFCGADVIRGAITGALSALGGAMVAIPGGAGIIIVAASAGALNKSLAGACYACHSSATSSYCGG